MLQGVSDGTQPLFSQYYGEQKPDKVRRVRRLAFQFGLAIALASVLLLYGLRYEAAVLFGASEEIVAMVGESLPIFILGFVFVAISRIAISYFYATEKNKYAYLLIYGEPLILAALLLILPQRCGIAGTWAAVPVSQLAVAVFSLGLLKKAQRKEKKIRIEHTGNRLRKEVVNEHDHRASALYALFTSLSFAKPSRFLDPRKSNELR